MRRGPPFLSALADIDPCVLRMRLYHGDSVPIRALSRLGYLELLLQRGITIKDLDMACRREARSALAFTAVGQDRRCLELLLQHSAVIPGSGALHAALTASNLDHANLLLDYGATVEEKLYSPLGKDSTEGLTLTQLECAAECRSKIWKVGKKVWM